MGMRSHRLRGIGAKRVGIAAMAICQQRPSPAASSLQFTGHVPWATVVGSGSQYERTRRRGLTDVVTHDRFQVTTIADALSDAVVGARDGVIHSWNAGAEQLFGYSAEEVIGKPVAVLYPAERQGELDEILARLRRGEAIEKFETVRRRKDGTEIEVSLSISPVRSPSGEIDGAAIVHDITARRHAEEIQGMLAEASRVLAVSLDYRATLPRVASLTLEGLADWCLIETVEADGKLSEVAVAHRDPDRIDAVRDMRRLYRAEPGRATIADRVLTTGRAELIPVVSDALLRNIAQDDEHLRMLRELELRSLVVVPMRARGRVLGTISLARAESTRRFGGEELELAEDIAQRAALTIDNANLYGAEREARRRGRAGRCPAGSTSDRHGRAFRRLDAESGRGGLRRRGCGRSRCGRRHRSACQR